MSATEQHRWPSMGASEVAALFGVDPAKGLSKKEAEERLANYGPNLLGKAKAGESFWNELLEEAREPMIILLFVTGVFYAVFGGLEDAFVIVAVIIALLGVEVVNEYRAGRAIASLQKLAEPVALVRREGTPCEVDAEQVVPGDVVLLHAGRRVPADARLGEAYGITVDEALLTGESGPVEKSAGVVLPGNVPLAETSNVVFAGTTILRGRGVGIAVATGSRTELARIGRLAAEVKPPPTLLQRTMNELTRWMVWVAVSFSAAVPLLGWLLVHEPPQQMLLTGLSLAFATIPEELPIIITMVLALGAYRLSRERVIVKRLQAVETLGAVTVIASDKTGTLTQNRMELKRVFPEESANQLLEVGVLCSAGSFAEDHAGLPTEDPLDTAILEKAAKDGISVGSVRKTFPLKTEFSFDDTRKMMSVVRERAPGSWVLAKGAPEAILARSDALVVAGPNQGEPKLTPMSEAGRKEIRSAQEKMAAEGLRVLAFAERILTTSMADHPGEGISQEEAERGFAFIGLAGFADPVRPEVKDAVAASRAAGIRTLMVTGDHPLTAIAVAKEIGLPWDGIPGHQPLMTGGEIDALSEEELKEMVGNVSVFARTTPEHKLRIVKALHAAGEVVAVTGDGINDAPALAASDIGIAMGETGTDVARETASIVLSDDDYSTIVRSVGEGRTLFSNLTKGVRYYLACKVALISITLLPVLLLVPVPFAPIQIILMELFMDLAAAATFVAEPAEPDIMKRTPRDPKARFLDRAMVSSILRSAGGLFLAVVVAYLLTWNGSHDLARAQTVAFATWLVGHVLLALNMRSEKEPLLRLGPFSNRLMALWVLVTLAFVAVVTLAPGAQAAFKTAPLALSDWLLLVIPLSVAGTFWLEARKWLTIRFGR